MGNIAVTITHKHTGETLGVITLPDTGDTRRDKFDALRTWRAANGTWNTPVRIAATRTN